MNCPPHVVVIGGGISGLAAAHELRRAADVRVTIVEGSPRTGGKLLRGEIAGITTDFGAEALLARRPEALQLIDEIGLSEHVVHPLTIQAGVWSRAAIRPLPVGHVMGVPSSLSSLAASGVVPPAAVGRAALDDVLPAQRLDGD